MIPPLRTTPPIRSVSAVVQYIRKVLKENKWLREIGVRGEISNFSRHSSGSVYFRLKENEIVLECLVWKADAVRLPSLKDGLAVVATGRIETYDRRSTYQLIAHTVTLEGVGDLHAEYEQLKKKLADEGAFDVDRKRPLPKFPFRIALVSSREGRGATDFTTEVAKRASHVRIVIVDTPVQGTGAAIEIADAIDKASRLDVDVIVVARGGGSFEDLFAFSTETVVRAILRSRLPVVSAVGHEKDVSISDLVADLRAPTPGLAANLIVPVRTELLRNIERHERTLERVLDRHLKDAARELQQTVRYSVVADPARLFVPRQQRLDRATMQSLRGAEVALRGRFERVASLVRRLEPFDPTRRLSQRKGELEILRYRLGRAGTERIERDRSRAAATRALLEPAMRRGFAARTLRAQFLETKLDGNNPEAILQRGYAIVRRDGVVVRDAHTVPVGVEISAKVARGTLVARVEDRRNDGGE